MEASTGHGAPPDPSVGGKARADSLSPSRRREIAQQAAHARWGGQRKATHVGALHIGDVEIPCAVLDDGRRVLSQQGFLAAIGRAKKAPGGTGVEGGAEVERLPPFLSAVNLKPFVSDDLARSTNPIGFIQPQGGSAYGFPAEILPQVCEVYLAAREAGVLKRGQLHVAQQAEILTRALARVGIVALVDEATGYQDVRAKEALQEILERYIAQDLAKWAKTFPDDFYRELFRLRGWNYSKVNVRRPAVVGHWTNNIVYERLAPGVLEELKRKNPRNESGNRTHRHFQWLTTDWGTPRLREHLWAVIALMRASPDWEAFVRAIDRALPRYQDMPLFADIDDKDT